MAISASCRPKVSHLGLEVAISDFLETAVPKLAIWGYKWPFQHIFLTSLFWPDGQPVVSPLTSSLPPSSENNFVFHFTLALVLCTRVVVSTFEQILFPKG